MWHVMNFHYFVFKRVLLTDIIDRQQRIESMYEDDDSRFALLYMFGKKKKCGSILHVLQSTPLNNSKKRDDKKQTICLTLE